MAGTTSTSGRYRDALAIPDYRRLVTAFLVDAVGSWAYSTVLTVYVFDRTGSTGWVTAFLCASWVPKFLIAPYAGVLADRYERTLVMRVSALSAMVAMIVLAVLVQQGAPLVALLVTTVVVSLCVTPYRPAAAALLVDVVDERNLTPANSLFLSLESVVFIIGPAFGGLLLVLADPYVAVAINALSFLVCALILTRLGTRSRPVRGAAEVPTGIRDDLMAGFRALGGQPIALTLLLYCLLCTGICGTTTVLFVAVSNERLSTGSIGLSYLLAAFAAGGVIAAAFTNRLSAGRLGPAVALGIVLESLPLAGLAIVTQPVVAGGLLIVSGGGMVIVDVLAITALQREMPRELLGRVFGVLDSGCYAATIGGSLLASLMVSTVGLRTTLVSFGVVFSVLAVAGIGPLLTGDRRAATDLAALQPLISRLATMDLFTGAGRLVLEQLARAVESVTVEAGSVVVAEGDPAEALYVLISGQVDVSSRGESGQERTLRTMGPNSLFGEIGILRGIPRTATVRAVEPTVLWRISGESFMQAQEAAPFSSGLLGQASDRLARTHPTLVATPGATD